MDGKSRAERMIADWAALSSLSRPPVRSDVVTQQAALARTGPRPRGGKSMGHNALKLAAALLVILGLAGAALVASRLMRPQPLEFGPPLNGPGDLGRIDALHGWAWDEEYPMVDGQPSSLPTGRLMLTDDGGLNWRAAALLPLPVGDSWVHPQVLFVDPDHGWFGPSPEQFPLPDDPSHLASNMLWRTSDGGRSWQSTELPSGPNSFGYAARVSSDIGFLLLAPTNQLTPPWTLYRTGDGGATWSPVATVPLAAGAVGQPPADVGFTEPLVFADESNGLLVEGNEGPTVLRTHDGGVTWTPIELPKPADPWAYLLSVSELRAFGSHVVMAAVLGRRGEDGTSTEPDPANYPVYTSDDAGRTWQATYPHEAGAFPVPSDQQYGEWSIVDPANLGLRVRQQRRHDTRRGRDLVEGDRIGPAGWRHRAPPGLHLADRRLGAPGMAAPWDLRHDW